MADNNYYRDNARDFFDSTVNVSMELIYKRFLGQVVAGGRILDAGCGSGRDAKIFSQRGFTVFAFDSSPELAYLASEYCGFEVEVRAFSEIDEESVYDGIWCCASLLHVPLENMVATLAKIWRSLKPGGCFYASYKLGNGEREIGGRRFTDADESQFLEWIVDLAEVSGVETWITEDQRPGREEKWLNVILNRAPAQQQKLVTGGDDHLLPHLSRAIAGSNDIVFAVAFVKVTGLRLLLPDIESALNDVAPVSNEPLRKVRFLTSDYLDVTDPEALKILLLLKQRGADVRVFSSKGGSFHLKAYIFANTVNGVPKSGIAFIGSSNISRQALKDGLEWNYKVVYPGDTGFLETYRRFEELFSSPKVFELTDAWIEEYERRRISPPLATALGSHEQEPPPQPTTIQISALDALRATREEGYKRGLVVLATGLGKTWLAAFDSVQSGARRVLFVAHREEILAQAAKTFVRMRPNDRVGFYMGKNRDVQVDVLFASVQTLSRANHLERFASQYFDYIVIDEFHHAAASTYRKLLSHFAPSFLLGLTATPDRTDQSDILSLCDDNLVFTCNLFEGIESKYLAPFHYYGISDDSVDYQQIPWRNGKFDPEQLTNKLATLARARHALREWRAHAQKRTLAFCASVSHAEFMATQFNKAGVVSAAIYSGSQMGRSEALEKLDSDQLDVIFSVDLFSEGVDVPSIDTVMMLRPTESKILFLQQLGRGLRLSQWKQHLAVLDFIGNHHSFLAKPQALFGVGATYQALAVFGRTLEEGSLSLPDGCYVNYDLKIIDFLKSLDSSGPQKDYEALKNTLGRRPTLSEFYRSGSSVQAMRQQYGNWFNLVQSMNDLSTDEANAFADAGFLLKEIETTAMTKSYKMVMLEAWLELDGISNPPLLDDIAAKSWDLLNRRKVLLADVPESIAKNASGTSTLWRRYWLDKPVNAWIGRNRDGVSSPFFVIKDDRFSLAEPISSDITLLSTLIHEIIDYRLASYEARRPVSNEITNVIQLQSKTRQFVELPYFPNLKIACGHFKQGRIDAEEFKKLPEHYGQLVPGQYFIARASGNSMNGGDRPIADGDNLLFQLVTESASDTLLDNTLAFERLGEIGESQYVLRNLLCEDGSHYILRAANPEYQDIPLTEGMRPVAKLNSIIDPLDLVIGQSFMREEIPALFGEEFNPGSWNVGHVVLKGKKAHVLLVTLNKQGKSEEHRYHDHWIDERTFYWQSQNSTYPTSKRGKELINHKELGISIYLFIRAGKLQNNKSAPFVFQGKVTYISHDGSKPMNFNFYL